MFKMGFPEGKLLWLTSVVYIGANYFPDTINKQRAILWYMYDMIWYDMIWYDMI